MENKVSEILKLICHAANGTYAYVLNAIGNDFVVAASWSIKDISPRDLKLLNSEIVQLKRLDENKIKEFESFIKLNTRYSIKSIKIFVIHSEIEYRSRMMLVILSGSDIDVNQKVTEEIEIINRLLLDEINQIEQQKNTGEKISAGLPAEIKNLKAAFFIADKNGAIEFTSGEFFKLTGLSKSSLPANTEDILFYKTNKSSGDTGQSLFTLIQSNQAYSNLGFLSVRTSDTILLNLDILTFTGGYNLYLFRRPEFSEQRESLMKELTDNLDLVIYAIKPDLTEYLFLSGSVEKVLGISSEEILNRRILLLRNVNPRHLEKVKLFLRSLKKGHKASVDYEYTDKFKNVKYLRHSGIPIIKQGQVVYFFGTVEDITSQKNIITKMEQSEERFRLLIDTADDLIFNLNKYGYFTSINNNGAMSLGYRPEELLNKHFLEFVNESGKADIAVSFQKILRTNTIVSFEAELTDKFGNSVIFEVQARPIKIEGEITGMLGIGRNITKRRFDENKLKDLNDKLIEANRIISIERDRAKQQIVVLEELNKLKNEFISNVSHELRTPLASIVGFAETIDSDPNLAIETVKEFNQIILNEGKRLAKLINDVLDFSKLESGADSIRFIQFDIVSAIRELVVTFSNIAKEKSIVFSPDLPEKEIIIKADRERLIKTFNHIVSNAFKFTKQGGRISIIVRDLLNEVEIAVSDTGVGIPESDLPSIFQKFKKVKSANLQTPGAGFGLVSVKQIIDLHKGLIRVNSEVGKGTTFIVKLPKNN